MFQLRRFALVLGLSVLSLTALPDKPAAAQSTRNEASSSPVEKSTEFGPAVAMGDGSIRTFSTISPTGKPVRLGVEFDGDALVNLPTTDSDGKWSYKDRACCGHEYVLQFPSNASASPFSFAVVNWNPRGHIPTGIWDLPHFDFHFYFMDESERAALTPGVCEAAVPGTIISCEAFARAMKPLPDDQQIPGYVNPGAVEAGMGAHLFDPTTPEHHGTTFTRSFIYGAWDGNLSFMEPMITAAELQKKEAEVCTSFPTPRAMPKAGYYPTEYCTHYDEDNDLYDVSLQAFRWFRASDGVVGD